jgi:hypothetical protein
MPSAVVNDSIDVLFSASDSFKELSCACSRSVDKGLGIFVKSGFIFLLLIDAI